MIEAFNFSRARRSRALAAGKLSPFCAAKSFCGMPCRSHCSMMRLPSGLKCARFRQRQASSDSIGARSGSSTGSPSGNSLNIFFVLRRSMNVLRATRYSQAFGCVTVQKELPCCSRQTNSSCNRSSASSRLFKRASRKCKSSASCSCHACMAQPQAISVEVGGLISEEFIAVPVYKAPPLTLPALSTSISSTNAGA